MGPCPSSQKWGAAQSLSQRPFWSWEGKGLQTLPREGLQPEAARPPCCALGLTLREGASSLSPVCDFPPPRAYCGP